MKKFSNERRKTKISITILFYIGEIFVAFLIYSIISEMDIFILKLLVGVVLAGYLLMSSTKRFFKVLDRIKLKGK